MGEDDKAVESLSPKERRQRSASKDTLDRAEREIRRLTEVGVDVAALSDRFESARTQFGDGRWSEAEMTCSEILILAKSMQAITSASMKAGAASDSKKMSDSMKAEISRIVAKEVGERVEAVARTLPTASSLEETVEAKIQEALVTGGLVARLESIASQKAKTAVASIPRFTAKDAQAAANLVVQRSLTQFLSSKDLAKKVKAAVEGEVEKALKKAEKDLTKSLGAHLETKIASVVEPLPSKKGVDEQIAAALKRFLREEPFETRVLEFASERAKAELERAPDLMSEAASKLAREAADSLFKTHLRSNEFREQVKAMTREAAGDVAGELQLLSPEDVEVIARRVGEESMETLAESEVLREKMDALGKELVARELSAEGFDEKVRGLAKEVAEGTPRVTPEEFEKAAAGFAPKQDLEKAVSALAPKEDLEKAVSALAAREDLERAVSALAPKEDLEKAVSALASKEDLENKILESRRELMTNKDFAEWVKDGALAAIGERGLGEGMAELEKKFLTAEQAQDFLTAEKAGQSFATADNVEEVSRREALDAAQGLLKAEEFSQRLVELLGDEEVREQLPDLGGGVDSEELELQMKKALAEQLESSEFVDKVKEVSGGDNGDELREELVSRVDRIEQEALPALIESILGDKLGGVSPQAIDTKVQEAMAAKLDGAALNQQILQLAQQSIGQIANTPEFKEMLDGKFKIMMKYISQEVIPKQIRRQMGGG